MKTITVAALAVFLQASSTDAKKYSKNVPTFEVEPGATIEGNKITYDDPDCDPGFTCTVVKTCSQKDAIPTLTADQKFFACCLSGLHLLGSPETAFDCCADGHDLVGSAEAGYHCCPTGYTFDGQVCKELCKGGKELVDGKCVCPTGTVEDSDGNCKPKTKCESGLKTGKCYIFTAENGNKLGLQNDGYYYAAPDSMIHRYGKFQLCGDETCKAGQDLNPSNPVYIRDTYGDVGTGANKGQWLNNAKDGLHISRTPNFLDAGKFALTKWPCGKYCLGGVTMGIGPACPAEFPAMTFYSQDPQMCVAFDLTEVPCDIKSDDNNCIWKSGDQCCNKIDCSKTDG